MADDINQQLENMAGQLVEAVNALSRLVTIGNTITTSLTMVNDNMSKLKNNTVAAARAISSLTESLKKGDKQLSTATDKIEDLGDATKAATTEQRQSVVVGRMRNDIEREWTRIQEESAKQEAERAQLRKKLYSAAKDMFFELRDVAKDLTKTVFNANSTFADYGKVANQGARSLGDFVGRFGLLGAAIGGIIKFLGGMTEAALKVTDNQNKAAFEAAQFGVNTGITTQEIYNIGRQASRTSEELAEYVGIIKGAGASLGSFGNNVADSVKAIGEMTKMSTHQVAAYYSMGVSQRQLTKLQVDFLKIQTESGMTMRGNQAAQATLNQRSREYINNLVTLRDLTGVDIEEQQRRQETQRRRLEVNTKMRQLELEAAELEKESRFGEAEAKRREKKNLDTLITDMAATYGEASDQYSAAVDMAIKGYTTTSSAYVLAADEMQQGVAEVMKSGRTGKLIAGLTDAYNRGVRQFGDAIVHGGKELGDAVGQTVEGQRAATVLTGLTAEEIDNNKEETFKRINAQAKGQIDDNQKRLQAEFQQLQRAAALAKDGVLNAFSGPIKSLLDKFGDALRWLARTIIRFVKWAADFIPGLKELTQHLDEREFYTVEEIKKKMAGDTSRLAELESKLKTKEKPAGFEDYQKYRTQFEELSAKRDALATRYGKPGEDQRALEQEERELTQQMNQLTKGINDQLKAQGTTLGRMTLQANQDQALIEEIKKLRESIAADKNYLQTRPDRVAEEAAAAARPGGAAPTGASGGGRVAPVKTEATILAGTQQLERSGVRMARGKKYSDVVGGGEANEQLILIAQQIQEKLGGNFAGVTGLKDGYDRGHQSAHDKGLAMDFVLADRPNRAEGEQIAQMIRAIPGVRFVLDEYNNPSRGATGPHFHVEVTGAAKGGLFSTGGVASGPSSGYASPFNPNMALHRTELVKPLRIGSLLDELSQTDAKVAKEELAKEIVAAGMNPGAVQDAGLSRLAEVFRDGIREVVNELSSSRDLQQQMVYNTY